MIKVSIIMPMLNSIKYLKECIDSVCNQTLKEIEILIVDGGSTDGTLELVNEYSKNDNRIKVINSDMKSHGRQCNLGMDNAIGEFVGFVESDDFVELDMFEIFYKECRKKNLDWIFANYNHFMEYPKINKQFITNKIINDSNQNIPFSPKEYPERIRLLWCMWSGIYSLDMLRKNDIRLNESLGASFQDIGFYTKTFMNATKAMFIDKIFYNYRRDNIGSSTHSSKGFIWSINEYEKIYEYLQSNKELLDIYEEQIFYKLYSLLVHHYPIFEEDQKIDGMEDAKQRYRNLLMTMYGNLYLKIPFNDTSYELDLLNTSLEKFDEYMINKLFMIRNSLNKHIESIKEQKQIAIFGCGPIGFGLASLLLRLGYKGIDCFYDNNVNKQGTTVLGIPVKAIDPDNLRDVMYIIAGQSYNFTPIKQQLLSYGIDNKDIWNSPMIHGIKSMGMLANNENIPYLL